MEHDCKSIERLGRVECNIDKLYARTDTHSVDIAQIKIQLANAIALCDRVLAGVDKLTENVNRHTTEAVEYRAKIDATAKRVDEDEKWMEKKYNDLIANIDAKEVKRGNTSKFVIDLVFKLLGSAAILWVIFNFLVRIVVQTRNAGLY